jgi:hypothetical protein
VRSGDTDQPLGGDSGQVLLDGAGGVHQYRGCAQVKESEKAAVEIDAHGDQEYDSVAFLQSLLVESSRQFFHFLSERIEPNFSATGFHQSATLSAWEELYKIRQPSSFSYSA